MPVPLGKPIRQSKASLDVEWKDLNEAERAIYIEIATSSPMEIEEIKVEIVPFTKIFLNATLVEQENIVGPQTQRNT